jgi:serine/threonine protein kinase
MLTGRRLFQSSKDRVAQLQFIIDRRGMPTVEECKEFEDPRLLDKIVKKTISFSNFLDEQLPQEAAGAKQLLMRMLEWRPTERITADGALKDPIFDDLADPSGFHALGEPEQRLQIPREGGRRRKPVDFSDLQLERVTPQAVRV